MISGMTINNKTILILFLAIMVFSPLICVNALSGTVDDVQGKAVLGATVVIVSEQMELNRTFTDNDGFFTINVQDENLDVYIYADIPDTPGIDFVPQKIDTDGNEKLNITLLSGSSILLQGTTQFVDTENIALKATYSVTDPDNKTLNPSGVPFMYDTNEWSIARVDLPYRQIVVPADTYIRLEVNCSFILGSQVAVRNFTSSIILTEPQGSVLDFDISKYSIPLNFRITEKSRDQLDSTLDEMQGYGFYLTRQKADRAQAQKLLEESFGLYSDGFYSDSFDKLKLSYITFSHTHSELNLMFKDASLSVYIIIVFLALASLITGYLLVDGVIRELWVGTVIYAFSLLIFYISYPGSRIVDPFMFVILSIISVIGFTALGSFAPRIFSASSIDDRVNTRNLIIPIFDIAKRSLRRRRFRFLLTLISITLLVMSFVTLTSFSEGYGLLESDYSRRTDWQGVFIRDASWTASEPTFIYMSGAEVDWLQSQSRVVQISSKAENIPQQRPLFSLQDVPINGVLGLGPEEDNTVGIRRILLQGNLPSDGGILISRTIADSVGLNLGDTVPVGLFDLEVQGFFDDAVLNNIVDLDGSSYLPNRWVNINPYDEPDWVLETCEPQETIILNVATSLRFSLVGVQRISLQMGPETELQVFAQRLALVRGYLAYASTLDGFWVIRLGNYFEGKGFTLIIPWAIVVLNVVVTMLNALYERRKEIEILSSVGLNPAQVSAIFIAEASMTGFIAGGLGYLVGTGLYKGMATLSLGLLVNQKVSAVWSIASIAVAISAVLTGALVALRSSVVITPSLQRRWRIDGARVGFEEPWYIRIPVKLLPEEVDNYIEFILRHLRRLQNDPVNVTSSIKLEREENLSRIIFVYKSAQSTTGNFYTKNVLMVKPLGNNEYGVELESIGETEWAHMVGSRVRQFTMDYSTERGV